MTDIETPFQKGENLIKQIYVSIYLTMLEQCLVTLKDNKTCPKHIIWNTVKFLKLLKVLDRFFFLNKYFMFNKWMRNDSVTSLRYETPWSWGIECFRPARFMTQVYLILLSFMGCLKSTWRCSYCFLRSESSDALHSSPAFIVRNTNQAVPRTLWEGYHYSMEVLLSSPVNDLVPGFTEITPASEFLTLYVFSKLLSHIKNICRLAENPR